MTSGNPWLPYGTCPEAGMRLLCLPHAGAGAATYRNWGQGLPPEIAACPVQPPGRERRYGEEPFASVEPLAKELAGVIADSVRAPYAVFGHSTGALCAFETLRELRRIDGPLPVHLFVSGRCAPQTPLTRHDLASMDLVELADLLRQLGGTPEEVLAEPDLLALLQPLLAADFSVNQGYAYTVEPPLDIPVTAFAGIDDQGADVALTEPWAIHTAREFALHALPGGHFAIFDSAAAVHSHIAAALAPYCGD
ncbi:thioesterase II family protein [Streptomyces chartreusis]|uniref:thioesterase II family protein n=1 Tax=Streptomyces chartreusis TaxID=1969 RepID=UPI0033CBE119